MYIDHIDRELQHRTADSEQICVFVWFAARRLAGGILGHLFLDIYYIYVFSMFLIVAQWKIFVVKIIYQEKSRKDVGTRSV